MKAYTVKESVQLTVEAESMTAAVVKVRKILRAAGFTSRPLTGDPELDGDGFEWGYWCREADGDREPVTHRDED